MVIPRLHDFVNRAERIRPFKHASIVLNGWMINIAFGSPTRFGLNIRCESPDRQLSSITQIFGQQLPLLSHAERLRITGLPFPWGRVEWEFDSGLDASRGWKHSACLPLCRAYMYQKNWCPLLQPLCKSSRRRGPWKRSLRRIIYSWKDFSHLDRCRKP